MTEGGITAPALSTHQDNATFEFQKVLSDITNRSHLALPSDASDKVIVEQIKDYYSIQKIVNFLKLTNKDEDGIFSPKYKHVTLQFPDSLICDSARIVYEIQKELGITTRKEEQITTESNCASTECCQKNKHVLSNSQTLWILADTSYSSCCIDEVAAEHVQSDLVIHFGDACLNVVKSLPAAYVFGKPKLNLDNLIANFKDRYSEDKEQNIMLMANAPHTQYLRQLYNSLIPEYPNLVYADLHLDPLSDVNMLDYEPTPSHDSKFIVLNRTIVGLHQDYAEDEINSVLSKHNLFHISLPEPPRLLQLTTTFQSITTFDTETESLSQGPFPNLMRRYRYMHMARSAGTVGLLVNTLSLANTKQLIDSIGKKIKEAGKKHYIFVVGKPNVAKLANFENIDIWCILGCDHQGIIIDQNSEYFKPIVTPYELLLALGDEFSWTGKWVTDFNEVLKDMSLEEEPREDNDNKNKTGDDYEDEAPEFDPVTGRYVSTSRPLRKLQHLQISAEEQHPDDDADIHGLVKRFSSTVAIKNTVSTSAVHLQNRHWTGLGSDFQNDGSYNIEEEGAIVEDGRSGIARGYDYDNANKVL